LVDEQLNLVSSGIIGEMCIGGAGVARGYLNRPELNATKFVEVPWQTGAILYRTGDLARWTLDGKMQYLGRADDQVKVKGYRVELGEIESKMLAHPDIELTAVTVFQPRASRTKAVETQCTKCGLPDNYPGTTLDTQGVCNTCRDFDTLKERFRPYFKTMADLQGILKEAKRTKTGKYDCMVLYSGGKDSTYMLYQLVKELGMTPLVFSHDNGYISEEAKDNIRRVTDDLNVDLVFGQTPQMNAIFVDSLRRHSNVCDGCFKVIYTLSINMAREKGIHTIFTGLSRGQLFETRLSDMFEARIFDVDEIDRTVLEARKAYHRMDDAVSQLLDVDLFSDDTVFDDVQLVDFYRYKDVPLHEVFAYLDQHAPWVRPSDTGRSTNCLINEVGIYIHKKERGYHNYALPYSWDVRIGHKRRSEALEELDDDIDETRVRNILRAIGYVEPDTEPTQLVAHFSARQPLPTKVLRQFLNQSLPDYMIPTFFVQHEQMPLTANGKIDRAALPDPTEKEIRHTTEYVEPVTDREQKLAKVWAEVFQLESIGVHDNFFDLGGDSIISIQIVAKAGQAGLYFSPQQLFTSQTIADLAPVVEVTTVSQAEQGPVTGPVALTPIAHWFFDQHLSEPNKWNMSVLVDVATELQPQVLEKALQHVIGHHDMLRARFVPADSPSGWQQVLVEKAPLPTFQVVDLGEMPLAEQRLCAKEKMFQLENSHRLTEGRLIAAAYFKGAMSHTHRLFITVHHLVVDGFSWNILLQDLERAYHQLSRGEPVSLPAKTISVQDWSEKLAQLAQTTNVKKEVSHWSTVFEDVLPTIPVDIQSGDNREGDASVVTVSLDQKDTQALLKEVPSIYNTQMNDFLLSALAQVLTEWTGGNAVLINLEGHGREDILPTMAPPARTIGWFTSIFPVKLTLPESTDPGEKLKAIKEQLRAIPNKGIGFGLLRYLCQDQEVRRQLAGMATPQVLFNYLGQFDAALPDTAIFRFQQALTGWRDASNPRTQLLEINTWIVGGQLQVNWTYSKKLHHPSTIERLAERYISSARTLIDHCLSSEAGGVTPSDFPLANLDEKKLDQLANILDSLE
jgi:non-ribosomal peptide synthase protein (TIGR01720 family)